MRRAGVVAVVVATMAALGACSGGSRGHPGPNATYMLRGTELPSFSCNAQADGKAVSVLPAFVVELRMCPVAAPEPFDRPSHPISLSRGSALFKSLLTALSLPDAPAGKNQLCPEYAELLPTIIATDRVTSLVVHIPADSCGHSLPKARAALSAVISPSPAGATM